METNSMAINLETIVGLKSNVNAYTPIFECVVNSINSIREKGNNDGEISVYIDRYKKKQESVDGSFKQESPILGFSIIDNGVGFNDKKTNAFDEPFTDNNKKNGGIGYGRFTSLKVFESVLISSTYVKGNNKKHRDFVLKFTNEYAAGRKIISEENVIDVNPANNELTTVKLVGIREYFRGKFDIQTETIAKRILEHLLPYFVKPYDNFPKIIVCDDETEIVLNDFLAGENCEIWEIENCEFKIQNGTGGEEVFNLILIGVYGSQTQASNVILSAHNRAVTTTKITKYVPEFYDPFVEQLIDNNGNSKERNYYIRAYIIGDYLNKNINFQRESFNFPDEDVKNDMFGQISKARIEKMASDIIKEKHKDEYKERFEKKMEGIVDVINRDLPHFSHLIKRINKDDLPFTTDKRALSMRLYQYQYEEELEVLQSIENIDEWIEENKNGEIEELMERVGDLNADALARYMCQRKITIKTLKGLLNIDHSTGKHNIEETLHSIIYPIKTTSDETDYNEHNLWLLNENLVFSKYVVSDKTIFNKGGKRVDLAVFGNETVFRDDNSFSSPVHVYEFKRPGEELEKKDHIAVLKDYLLGLHKGEIKKDMKDRTININDRTPIYAYLVSDLCDDIVKLAEIHGFFELPDGKGYYNYYDKANAYIEILSWDKVVDDADKRHRAFFEKLKIDNI